MMDAITLLTNDHRTVDRLFDRYESLGRGAKDEKKAIVQEIVRELSIHASIEEQVLYPGIRDLVRGGDDLADEALDEHQEVKETLADLDGMEPSDRGFDAKVKSVIKDVRHHANEEETEMFPKLAAAIPKTKLEEMGKRMEKAKKIAPTRPHPHSPNQPPGNLVAGPLAAVIDRGRDAVGRRSAKRAAAKKSTAKKSTAKKSAAKKSAAKKSTAKKSSAKKSSAKRTTSKSTAKSSRSKTSARKAASSSSGRKGTSRKTTGRKSTSRRSSSR